MANLDASDVVLVDAWLDGGSGATNRRPRVAQVTLTLSSMGSATNKILASVLGFDSILQAGSFVKSDDSVIYPTGPSYDGSMLLFYDGADASPIDVSGTFRGIVIGEPAVASQNQGS